MKAARLLRPKPQVRAGPLPVSVDEKVAVAHRLAAAAVGGMSGSLARRRLSMKALESWVAGLEEAAVVLKEVGGASSTGLRKTTKRRP